MTETGSPSATPEFKRSDPGIRSPRGHLKREIANLAGQGILPPLMREWSDEVRELGNDAAHPNAGSSGASAVDARDVVQFLDYLLEYLYNLPRAIKVYRERRQPSL